MRWVRRVMKHRVFGRNRQHLGGINGVMPSVKFEVIACNLDPDFVPFLEGVKDRDHLYLIFVNGIRLRPHGILEWMERLPRRGLSLINFSVRGLEQALGDQCDPSVGRHVSQLYKPCRVLSS